jgi:hypothetical protein
MSLESLLALKSDLRDHDWEMDFFSKIAEAPVRLLSVDPQNGPEGFPYLLTTTYGGPDEPFTKIAHWCADKGVGLVLNPSEDGEDYLFTFGMLWNFKYRGEFYSYWVHEGEPSTEATMVVRQITDAYWPATPRKIFKEFLIQQGILAARMCLFSKSASSDPELAISLESLGNPNAREHAGILEAFSWFFPRHYSLVLMSEAELGAKHFLNI